jgi:hypothetical protein
VCSSDLISHFEAPSSTAEHTHALCGLKHILAVPKP